jgi:hypothetical protein
MAFLPSEDKKALRSKIAGNKECAVRSEACGEFKTLLSIKTQLRK